MQPDQRSDVDQMVADLRAQIEEAGQRASRAPVDPFGAVVAMLAAEGLKAQQEGDEGAGALRWAAKRVEETVQSWTILHDPAWVLRQIAAHRAILDEHERTDCRGHPDAWMKCGPGVCRIECWGCGRDWPCPTVRHLAEAYAGGDEAHEARRST